MFTFVQYKEEYEKVWDDFIDSSCNGTFLSARRFLNYHKTRFVDASILIYNEKKNLAAVCPACEAEIDGKRTFFSHRGSTFGGLIVDEKHYEAKYVITMLEELCAYVKELGFEQMYMKQTTDIFALRESGLFHYAYVYKGFTAYPELSTYVDFSQYKENVISNFAQGKRTNVHNCEKAGLTWRELTTKDEIADFYDILCENLQKYDTKPVHSLEELYELKYERLSEECGFYGIFSPENEMLAGSMMFYFDRAGTAHTQYLAARQAYNKLSPMSYMYYAMIMEMMKKGYKKLSWGTATEDLGRFLNMGLVTSKEDYGSRYCNNMIYYKVL